MPEWQQQVIEEHDELLRKIDKLEKYLISTKAVVVSGGAHPHHRQLLERQKKEMTAYEQTLKERISLFSQLR
jgi:hypothetical protein